MHKIKAGLILAALLAGCGTQDRAPAGPAPAPNTGQTAWQIVATPTPAPDQHGVPRGPIDTMPLLAMGAGTPYRDSAGVLRSPIDTMPLIPGDPNAAPMPGK